MVTGGSSGIGRAVARRFAAAGARVLVADLRPPPEDFDFHRADVSREGEVAELLDLARRKYGRLDVLVNNAGIIAMKRRVNADGHELTWATNFLGLVALTRALQGPLEAATGARVVNVSSRAQKGGRIAWDDLELERGYTSWRAYAQSKLAVVLWTREFAKRYPHLAANAMHPGAIATNIWNVLPGFARALVARILPPATKGAAPVVRLATSPDVEGVSGRYFDRYKDVPPSPAALVDADGVRLWSYAENATA